MIRVNTAGVRVFAWKGQPIADIEAWCKANQTKMIPYRYTKRYYDPFSRQEIEEYHEGRMPESFFDTMRVEAGEHYERRNVGDPLDDGHARSGD